jgi:nitric oxide synthase-interacting protein
MTLLSPHTTVAQKKDIKRQKDRLEALKKEVEEERARARQAARERVVRDFERGQLVLGSSSIGKSGPKESDSRDDECTIMFPLHSIQLHASL